MSVDFDVREQQGMDFFSGGSIIMDYGLWIMLFWPEVTVESLKKSCGLMWCFYQMFEPSSWRHPFTAED